MKPALVILVGVLASSLLPAREIAGTCGWRRDRVREELFLHQRSMAARKAAGLGLRSARAAAARDVGHLAILEDADGVIARRNLFNLDTRSISFTPSGADAARYRFQVAGNTFDAAAANAGRRVALDDDDSVAITLPFAFPFYGATHREAYVNSDGNLTFTAADSASSERSLGRLTAGPPRIAALFRDLDPSLASEGVKLLSEPGRVVVSWVNVPEYRDVGTGPRQTFQMRLYPDGKIELAYSGVTSQDAVVGITPGRLQGSSAVVAFASGSSQEFSSTVAERFSGTPALDTVVAAQKFYETHEDAYDYLVFINTLGVEATSTAVAYELTVRSNRTGIGDPPQDYGLEFGSRSRLQAVINLGPLSQYPTDPYGIVPRRSSSRDTPMSVIAHEAGHLFLAFASIRDPDNDRARPMLCSDGAHWAFVFNAEASLVSGNRIQDYGAGVSPRFRTVAAVEAFSPLDQYLMGLRAPEDVPPTFLVTRPTVTASSCFPVPGVSFDGGRRDIHVDEVIAAEGRRTPDHNVAQKHFRFAFILVTGKDEPLPAGQVDQVENYRREFETFFTRASSDRARAEASLKKSLKLSLFPAAGVVVGASFQASVSVEQPAASPLTVALRTENGAASAPSSVTIAQGAAQASFELRGVKEGVDWITAEVDDRFEVARAAVQVAGSLSSVSLEGVSGDGQTAKAGVPLPAPLVFRVTDRNNLPYPGVRVRTAVTGGGSVTPAVATTDETGTVRFIFTPGTGLVNEVAAALADLAGGPQVRMQALGLPYAEARSVVNAASFEPGLTPGGLATVFGANLTGGTVMIAGRAARALYSGDRQINFYVPATLPAGSAEVSVATPRGSTATFNVPVLAVQPGIFYDAATRLGAVRSGGGFLEIYATGLGAVRASISFPGLEETVVIPQVLLDGRGLDVLFSGLAPGFVGLYQVNARLPAGGGRTLQLVSGGQRSNEVLLP